MSSSASLCTRYYSLRTIKGSFLFKPGHVRLGPPRLLLVECIDDIQWQANRHQCAAASAVEQRNLATVRLNQSFADRQPKPRTMQASRLRLRQAIEFLKHARTLVKRNTRPAIADTQHNRICLLRSFDQQ